MKLIELFAARRTRVGVLAAAAIGAVFAVIGAFSGSNALLGVGAIVLGGVNLASLKLLFELATRASNSPVPALAARLDQLDQAHRVLADEQQRLADDIVVHAEQLSQEQAVAIEKVSEAVRTCDDAISAAHAAHDTIAGRLTALEARLTPSRRFSAMKPARDGTPRELALGEVLSASSVEPHPTD